MYDTGVCPNCNEEIDYVDIRGSYRGSFTSQLYPNGDEDTYDDTGEGLDYEVDSYYCPECQHEFRSYTAAMEALQASREDEEAEEEEEEEEILTPEPHITEERTRRIEEAIEAGKKRREEEAEKVKEEKEALEEERRVKRLKSQFTPTWDD
jgi:hypothetical protein